MACQYRVELILYVVSFHVGQHLLVHCLMCLECDVLDVLCQILLSQQFCPFLHYLILHPEMSQ